MTTAARSLRALPYAEQLALWKSRTDEKRVALAAIQANLPARRISFLDIGAGSGELTLPLSEQFQRTMVFDPNPRHKQVYAGRPDIKVVDKCFEAKRPKRPRFCRPTFDFILLSHVLYFLPKTDWTKLVGILFKDMLNKNGKVHVLLQSEDAQSSKLFNEFALLAGHFQHQQGLKRLMRDLPEYLPSSAKVERGTLESWTRAADEQELFQIALFFLAQATGDYDHYYGDIFNYCTARFRDPAGGFSISNHQDFLVITK